MNIVQNRKKIFILSLLLIAAGIVAMVVNGSQGKGILNFDIEFTGGTSLQLDIGQDFQNEDIVKCIQEVTGQSSPQVQRIVNTNNVSIRLQSIDGEKRTELLDALKEKYGITDENIANVSDISGTISSEMQRSAFLAVFVACLAMLVYITIRFHDFHTGASAIIALLHDCFIVIAFYAIFRIPVNTSFIAAILTVLGYSINATIVIFDRIRENKGKYKRGEQDKLINSSISQTLGRSINTSITTLLTIGLIYILGVSSIQEFALPLIIGILGGAYSSIFLSGSIWYDMLPKAQKQH